MLSRIWVPCVLAAGMAVLIVAVAVALLASDDVALGREGGDLQVEQGQDVTGEGSISVEEAVEAAQSVATGTVDDIELERRDGRVVYDIEVGGTDVRVDARDGSIVSTREDRDDNDDDRDGITDAAQLAAAISVDEAIEIARTVATGTVRDVELDRERGTLIYSIEIGQHEVEIDATTGTVLDVEDDD